MKRKGVKIPVTVIAIGLVLCLVACLLTCLTKTPVITEQAFDYSVTYQLDGETKTYAGVYHCKYNGYHEGETPWDHYYNEEYTVDGETSLSCTYTIAEKDGMELYIVPSFNACYLMGDTKDPDYESALKAPYLEAVDAEGVGLEEEELARAFDAKIISWEYPEPVGNTFAFSGFSLMYHVSMLVMLGIGLLVIFACLVLVKRDKTVPYKVLDKLSIVVNLAAILVAIPFITITVGLMPFVESTDSFLYQLFLCIPAVTAFTVGASIALRRKGFPKTGFFIQFVGPAVFAVFLILDYFVTIM